MNLVNRMVLPIFGFALAAAYLPIIESSGTFPRWCMLFCGCLPLLAMREVRITWAHLAGAAFVGWAALSLSWSPSLDRIDSMLKLAILAGVFVVGSTLRDLRPFYVGAAVGLGVSSALVLGQMAGWLGMEVVNVAGIGNHWYGGLFVNPMLLGEAAALIVVALAAHGMWLWILPVLPGLVLVGARGAIVSVAVAWFFCMWEAVERSKLFAVLALGTVAGGAGAVGLLRPSSVLARWNLWIDTWAGVTWFGHGYGSFAGVFPIYQAEHLLPGPRIHFFDHPHNSLLFTAFELGLPGVALALWLVFLLLWARQRNDSAPSVMPERLVIVAFLVEGCFAFADRMPFTAGVAALVAGSLSRDLPQFQMRPTLARFNIAYRR